MQQQFEQVVRFYQKKLVDRCMLITCINCDHWEAAEKTDLITGEIIVQEPHCGLFKQLPPPEVIVYGCPHWVDYIPF